MTFQICGFNDSQAFNKEYLWHRHAKAVTAVGNAPSAMGAAQLYMECSSPKNVQSARVPGIAPSAKVQGSNSFKNQAEDDARRQRRNLLWQKPRLCKRAVTR
jgi:hypothetical protein